tara:strand:- start:196 stop:504 length:309 start_codon:yes stop_codon:yes gene_type:complete
MGKKDKVVELKPRVEKISKEHLEQLQKTVNNINGIQFNIGKIEAQKHTLLHDLAVSQDQVALLQDMLVKEYGSYDVNLNDGTINWPKEPSSNGIEKPKVDEK